MKRKDRWFPEFEMDDMDAADAARMHLPQHELWSLLQAPSVSWIERARLP